MRGDLEERINECIEQDSTILNLYNLRLRDKDIIYLASRLCKCIYLETLSLIANDIGNEGVIALVQVLACTHITTLNLRGNLIGNEGAMALASVLPRTRIDTLYLDKNKIGDEGAMALVSALQKPPHIMWFSLFHNRVDDDVLKLIERTLEVNRHNYHRREWTMQDYCLMDIGNTSLVSPVVLNRFEQRKKDNLILFNNP